MDKTHLGLIFDLLEWQKKYPIGTQVEYIKEDGTKSITYTRSDPWVAPSGQAVILLVGELGYVGFEWIRPVEPGPISDN